MSMKIAILGWGSLLWDNREEFKEFVKQLAEGTWKEDGPSLPLEFSRVSQSRGRALTLVIDPANGTPTTVAWRLSKRKKVEDAINDLQYRESTSEKFIGWICLTNENQPVPSKVDRVSLNQSDPSQFDEHKQAINKWASTQHLDAVIWTNLESNFEDANLLEKGKKFTVEHALVHLQKLPPEGKDKAFEYIVRAPEFIKTALRTAVEKEPWFEERQDVPAKDHH